MATSVRAADGTEVIKESDKRTKSATEKTIYRMDLLDAFGKVQQSREIELYFKKGSDIESTLFKFTAPPVVQGTGLLIEDAGKSVNDIWMYVPATRRIRRISGTEKTNWFMGTEFTHEDFEDYKIASYSFNLAKEDSCGEKQTCYVIEATPSSPQEREASGYLKKIYWVEKTSLYPIRIDYVAKSGDVSKRLEVRKLAKQGKYWRPAAYEMHNLGNGRVTRLTALSREVDSSMDDFYVSQRYLRTE
ncbi:MAG: outer membrane lipoprotein-sorting protein [Burkholderiales bacterium]|nr:outer membrane lipoprotein-sorting protein [Burkholderiales bacterium]